MNHFRNVIAVFGFVFLFAFGAFSQNAPLTKDMIIQMVKAGLPEDVIISKIKTESNLPNLSTDDLIALKSAGVSDGVIRALLSPAPKPEPPTSSGIANAPLADPNDPLAAHDPGIYLMVTAREGGRKLVLIERSGAGRERTARGWVKAQIKAELPGRRAAVRAGVKPEFYMYFPPTGNLGAADSISSPSQFSLLSLELKKDHRETAVAKQGFGGASAGMDEKKTVTFAVEKIRAYAYKVTPNASLKAGEYAFVAATGMIGVGSGSAVVIYDFGVDE